MNGEIKWHKPTGPAFIPGECWVGTCGKVTIVSVRKYPGVDCAGPIHISDYGITYSWQERGKTVIHEKDGWNFQIRYTHSSDIGIKPNTKLNFLGSQ